MALPVTGPFAWDMTSYRYDGHKTWYRQKRPYKINLAHSFVQGWAIEGNNSLDAWRWRTFADSQDYSATYAQAYARLVSKLGDSAGLGVTLAQWKQADGMISKRANQLSAFTTQLVRRSPIGVAASLGISIKEAQRVMGTRYGVARKLSDLWLEFWFGWKPLVSDIFTACEVFDQPIPWGRIRATRRRNIGPYLYQKPAGPFSEGIWFQRVQQYVGIGVDVRLVNPNLHLLNQFGLLNPAVVAWDAVPWSFVIDWFANVSSWLGSFTDFAGIERSNGYVTRRSWLDGVTYWTDLPEAGGYGIGKSLRREVLLQGNIPRPSLVLRDASLKPARALTAITLLVQKLPRQSAALSVVKSTPNLPVYRWKDRAP